MNIAVLIDAVVRQTVVLLAQLATASGARADLANVADEVFVSLTEELRSQGVSSKVIADMFGMLLRSYHKKVRRLEEGRHLQRATIWRTALDFISDAGTVSQADVLRRFRHDDEHIVRGVLADLHRSGLISCDGRGHATQYARTEAVATEDEQLMAVAAIAWIEVYRRGPIQADALAEELRIDAELATQALEALVSDGRIEADGQTYFCEEYAISLDHPAGWEAAVFDHFQAVVTTITARLSRIRNPSAGRAEEGGSTYVFDLWPGHPLEQEVLSVYAKLRQQTSALRQRVEAHSGAVSADERDGHYRVTFYAGQHITDDD